MGCHFFLSTTIPPPPPKKNGKINEEELQEQLPFKNRWVILCSPWCSLPYQQRWSKEKHGEGVFIYSSPFYSSSSYPLCFWFCQKSFKPRKCFSSSVILVYILGVSLVTQWLKKILLLMQEARVRSLRGSHMPQGS